MALASRTFWFLGAALILIPITLSLSCDKVDSCTCDMSDGSGQINLRSIGLQEGNDSVFSMPGGDGWLYKYNPCYEFSWGLFDGLAVVQTTKDGAISYDLGVQQSVYYNSTDEGTISIHYAALDLARTSRIILVCTAAESTHNLRFVGELAITEYDFILESPCACPGFCDENGILNSVGPKPTSNIGDINVNVHNPNQAAKHAYMWMDVGGAMTSLVFHDFFLVFLIVGIVFALKYAGILSSESSSNGKGGFSPSDVTGGPIPPPRENGDGIRDDAL